LYCINCGNHQREGQFCAKCGTALGGEVIGTRMVATRRQTTDYAEKLSALFKGYGQYFWKHLKQPGEVFTYGKKEFANAMGTIGMLSVFVGLAIFICMREIESPSLSMIGSAMAYVLVTTLIVVGSLYVTTMFLGPEQSIKNLISLYGTHLIPSTALVVIAFLFLLLKINILGNLLLLFALLFALFIVPLYIVVKLLSLDVVTLDPLYSVAVYLIISGVISYISLAVFGDFIMEDMLKWLSSSFIK
jgi:hypothetical protein